MAEYEDKHVSVNPVKWVSHRPDVYQAVPDSKLHWQLTQDPATKMWSISLNAAFPELPLAMDFVQMFQDGADDWHIRKQAWEIAETLFDERQIEQAENEGMA